MKSLTLAAVLLFFVAFTGVYLYNSMQATEGNVPFEFKPPYAFAPGDLVSNVNAFFFVFLLSLLLFGVGGIVSMALEGLKFGYLLSASLAGIATGFHLFDLLFIIPELMACIAATTLGAGLILDYRGKASLFPYWNYSIRYFSFGLFIMAALLAVRPFLVTL